MQSSLARPEVRERAEGFSDGRVGAVVENNGLSVLDYVYELTHHSIYTGYTTNIASAPVMT